MQLSKAILALSLVVFTSVAAMPAHSGPDSKDGAVHIMDKKSNMNIANKPMYRCKGSRKTCQKSWKKGGQKDGTGKVKKPKNKKPKNKKPKNKDSEGKPKSLDGEQPEKLEEKPDGPPPSSTTPEQLDTKTPPGEEKPTPSDPTVNTETEDPLTENPDTTTP
ncbi:hypothetical protein L211DRAFT_130668 [Terfezia boudieri ATCC MYA-4762]|uniref:Uncharacterized protein n=1 Tax=Terfezia boudieri ATCC MYA-4762 TaxID=1051890 RepID=A0A3N4LQ35_9PEZI|nr:hypothetical protein L211DRAFT_130668 [Terfezia boudieri ATCC MYA-4762]